jgi:NAD(P)H-hydrate epimerase
MKVKIGTAEIIRNIDKYCIENLGIPSIVLMENAALKVLKNLSLDKHDSFVIVCGRGNNGGDALAVARHLYSIGKHIEVFLLGLSKMSTDCEINYNILKNMGIRINNISNVNDIGYLRDALNRCEVAIDGIFGTGLSRNVSGIYDMVITIINENSSNIISIDVPSGFESNTGRVLGNCIKASKTISFQLYKRGFINYDTDKLIGEIIIEKIGIPEFAVDKFHNNEFIIDKEMVKKRIRKRNKYSYKGNYGRVTVIAGSKGFTGAAVISTQAAVRSGAGLVTLCCTSDVQSIISSKLLEAMTANVDDEDSLQNLLKKSDVIAIGPGMGNNNSTLRILEKVIKESECPLVIDADAINVLKGNLHLLEEKKGKVILTPHLGEMSRITGMPIEIIKQKRLEIAKEFAYKYRIILLLKGYNTIITDGETSVINPTGNSAMASGGMGDCLTGMIASFIAQGYSPMEAAYMSAYIHGYCGEELSEEMFCVNAGHVLEYIPYCIKEVMS